MARSQPRSAFQRAVEATPDVTAAYRPGIQALEPVDKLRLVDKEQASGSLFLDAALKKAQPNANRWDYGIGLVNTAGAESVLWLEVHHAASGQADLVVKKLTWLKDWLRNRAPALDSMPRKFVWLLSNVETNPNDRRRRNSLAETHGLIRVQGKLRLADPK